MKLIQWIREVISNPRKYLLTITLGFAVIIVGYYSFQRNENRRELEYRECLDQEAVQVNGNRLTFRDAAVYIAYEEREVESQALVYNDENSNQYWNIHTDGEFVRVAARNAVIQMMIHDEIFYQMAREEHIELTEEEQKLADNSFYDFWSDLVEEEKVSRLGVNRQDVQATMERMAIAQKYQEIYAAIQGEEAGAYDFAEKSYETLLEDNTYKVNEKVWERLQFGNITLVH